MSKPKWVFLSAVVAPDEVREVALMDAYGRHDSSTPPMCRIVVVRGRAYTLSDYAFDVARQEGWSPDQ